MATKPLMILVAGPYSSGTEGDPVRIQANVDAMARVALSPGTQRTAYRQTVNPPGYTVTIAIATSNAMVAIRRAGRRQPAAIPASRRTGVK